MLKDFGTNFYTPFIQRSFVRNVIKNLEINCCYEIHEDLNYETKRDLIFKIMKIKN